MAEWSTRGGEEGDLARVGRGVLLEINAEWRIASAQGLGLNLRKVRRREQAADVVMGRNLAKVGRGVLLEINTEWRIASA
jgi:hypothetical protein